jgi:hypothetical protein
VNDFEAVHARLREILLKHRGDLSVTKDGQPGVAIEIPGLEGKPWGYVAGTRVGTDPKRGERRVSGRDNARQKCPARDQLGGCGPSRRARPGSRGRQAQA